MRARLPFFLGLLGALASGCTALIDLDQYVTAECTELRMQLEEFDGPHKNHNLYVRALDESGTLQCLVQFEPYGVGSLMDIRVPGALDPDSRHVDFYADANGNGVADSAPPDHSWVIEQDDFVCADQDPTVTNFFAHTTFFDQLPGRTFMDTGLDALMIIRGVDAPLETFELHISYEIGSAPPVTRTVGVFRRPQVTAGDPREVEAEFQVRIPGIMDDGVIYTVELWNDTNGNQAYDAPPTDQAWILEIGGDALACPTGDMLCTPVIIDTDLETTADIGGIYINVL